MKKVDTIFERTSRFAMAEARMVVYNAKFHKKASLGIGGALLLVVISFTLFGSSLFMGSKTAQAATCTWTGTVNSNWSEPGNWSGCGGVIPQTTDTVSFTSGSVASTVDTAFTIAGMTVNGYAGTITLAATLDINGNLTTYSGTIDCGVSPNYTITVGGTGYALLGLGSTINNGTIFTYKLYTRGATYNGATSLTKTGEVDSLADGGDNTFNGPTTITNSGSGYLSLNTNGTDNYYDNVEFINNATTDGIYVSSSYRTANFYKNVTSTVAPGSSPNNLTISTDSTANFVGTGTQTLSGGWYTITNLNHTGSGALQMLGNVSISYLTNTDGIIDANGYNITATTFSNEATLKLKGNETISTPTNGTGSLVQYYGTSGPYIVKTWAYDDLRFSSATSTTYNLAAALTVNDALTIDANNTLNTASGSNYAINLSGNLTINGTLTANSSTITVGGNWDSSGGTFNYGTSTLVMTGVSKTIVTPSAGNAWDIHFYNVTIGANGQDPQASVTVQTAAPTGGFQILNSLILWGTLTISGSPYNSVFLSPIGTLTINSTGVLAGGGQFWRGLNNTSTPITNSGTISVSLFTYATTAGTTSVQITATTYGGNLLVKENGVTGSSVVVGTAGGQTLITTNLTVRSANNGNTTTLDNTTNNANINCASLQVGDSNSARYAVFKAGSGTITASGSVTINATDTSGANEIQAGSATINVAGNWTNSDTFTAGTSTVTFTASSGIQTLNSGGSSFYNITHSGVGTLQLAAAVTMAGSFNNSAGTFDTKSGSNYGVTVAGNWTNSSTFTANAGTVTFNGTTTQSVNSGGAGSPFYYFEHTGSSTLSLMTNGLYTNQTFEQRAGTFDANDFDMNITGLVLVSGGTFNAGIGTMNFNGGFFTYSYFNPITINGETAAFNITGDNTNTAYNGNSLTLNAPQGPGFLNITGNLSLANDSGGTILLDASSVNCDINVDGNVFLTHGTLSAPAATDSSFTVGGNWTLNGGAFTHNSGTVTLSGAGGSTQVVSGDNTFNNLTATASSARTINFASGSTTTVAGTWTATGSSGQNITLGRNGGSGVDQWNINPTAWSVDYVTPANSNNQAGFMINPVNYTDGGNNTNWFSANTAPNSPSSLVQKKVTGGITLSVGDWTNETQVQFEASATDTDNPDTLYLCIEKDQIGTAFSNTEDSCGSGVAYSGSGVTVTHTISSQTDAAEYHWQARVKDTAGEYSSWVSYGGNTDPNDRDYGIDTTAPTGGTVNDGQTSGGDLDWNTDGSLTSLIANWTGTAPDSSASGLQKYEYALRRQTDNYYWTPGSPGSWGASEYWYNNGTGTSFTVNSLNLQTGVTYYVSLKTTDNASNVSTISSNGIQVQPTLSFSIDSNTITFDNLNNGNDWTNTKTTTFTTSTNASSGYTIQGFMDHLLISPESTTIQNFYGTWSTTQLWDGLCEDNSSFCGFGYGSNDPSVQSSDRFAVSSGNPTKFAAYSQTGPGNVLADHTDVINGSTGSVSNEEWIVTHKVSVSSSQAAAKYSGILTVIITANY